MPAATVVMASSNRVPLPSFTQDLITHSNLVPGAVPVKLSHTRILCRVAAAFCLCFRPRAARVYETVEAKDGSTMLQQDLQLEKGRKTLVLDLDETLVHSSLTPLPSADLQFSVLVANEEIPIYVNLRPGLQHLLESVKPCYDIVVFTASLAVYADPLLDIIDKKRLVGQRLFREDCQVVEGLYVKDLGRFGRDMGSIVIVDV